MLTPFDIFALSLMAIAIAIWLACPKKLQRKIPDAIGTVFYVILILLAVIALIGLK